MSYEIVRTAVSARLSANPRIPPAVLHDILQDLDIVAADYTVTRACTDLITVEEIPQPVQMYCAALAVEGRAQGTISGYLGILRTFFQAVRKPFNAVTTNDIRVYMFKYQQTHNIAKSTLEHFRIVINGFYGWCVDEELMERNPARRIQPIEVPPPERTAMQPIELEYMRQACKSPREKALVDFLYSTGCRVSECAAVMLEDIDWKERSVHIRHGKGDKPRTVYFNAEAEVSMKAYIESKPHESAYLFSKTRAPYGRITSRALQVEIANIRERASDHLTTHITPHVFRHTTATAAIRAGMPVEQVQQLLGHASLDTTMRYAHTDQQDVKASHRKFIA